MNVSSWGRRRGRALEVDIRHLRQMTHCLESGICLGQPAQPAAGGHRASEVPLGTGRGGFAD